MLLTGDDFNDLFRTFASSAFKMETRDRYDVAGERAEYQAFLDGADMPKEWEDSPWVRSMTGAGKSLRRVHILRSPLTDYLRFELGWGYVGNARAGEDIRIIDLAELNVTGLPDHDFWLFDDSRAYRMHYSTDDEFLGAEPLHQDLLPQYLAYRDTAWRHAIPYADYWRQPA
ncbi:hypothetical protein OG500_12565 [Kitasatospora sp. NBC_01250]|uniref:DUF6879 family protein n=1 Tax=unclassified Kitasatospora TaxID=2633591 RepID=UPI002E0F7E16|nr:MULTISPECIES: DUF6879 family protein [unclassified Kitasatospora]WSJ66962.1 hypothetical protein OG294_13020 [Kitasatospora sp. NBC_01302]